jgi:hypothetical protein
MACRPDLLRIGLDCKQSMLRQPDKHSTTACRYYISRHSLASLKDVGLQCFKGKSTCAWRSGAAIMLADDFRR